MANDISWAASRSTRLRKYLPRSDNTAAAFEAGPDGEPGGRRLWISWQIPYCVRTPHLHPWVRDWFR